MGKYLQHWKFLAIFLVGIHSGYSHADWPLDFLRISCIPESHFLRIELFSTNGPDVLVHAQYEDKAILKAWQDNGFFSPKKLSHECKFDDGTYRITATQPEVTNHQCGGEQNITFSLSKNGKTVIDKAIFGGNGCWSTPGIHSIEIVDVPEGWGDNELELTVLSNKDGKLGRVVNYKRLKCNIYPATQQELCHKYAELPVSQESIEAIVEQGIGFPTSQ